MIQKVCPNVWKIPGDGNVYLLEEQKIVIDTGSRAERQNINLFLSKVVPLEQVRRVIFTHLHHDHIGNFDLFKNAEFFASKQAINDFENDPAGTVLDKDMAERFSAELKPATKLPSLEIIHTPGHTRGSICIFYPKEKVLFSGDTLFSKSHGRLDLPTSAPDKMHESLAKLVELNHKILCAGHDYD
jgi:glyoxylase-like metal-dependent hydrolase (beta-lactamase superfamily II)